MVRKIGADLTISIKKLFIHQGDFCLRDISFDIEEGSYTILMGRTGSGKTTLIEAICGLRRMTRGQILLKGRDVSNLDPSRRGIGYVPQDGALFKHLNVKQNITFALDLRGHPKKKSEKACERLAEQLQITDLLDRSTKGLSGGEKQRVAMGRALIFKPDFLLLDEPLSATDPETHAEMCELLKKVCKEQAVTTLHITHNPEEALTLAEAIFKLDGGVIIRCDKPSESERAFHRWH